MLEQNEVFDKLKLPESFYTYSYPEVSNENGGVVLRDKFINAVKTHVVGEEFSEHLIINQALYEALLGKQKVLLGEIPEILYRQIVANSFELDQLKDLFKFLLDQNVKLNRPLSSREAAYEFLPHVFQAPRDLYLTAMLKEAFQATMNVCALVESHHVDPIGHYWVPPPSGINFTEATKIPERRLTETDEDMIEKHALLDSLLEKRAWAKNYISNPFVYLVDDLTQVKKETVNNWIKCFQFHFQKYERLKKEYSKTNRIPSYYDRIFSRMENRPNLDQIEIQNELKEMKQLFDSGFREKQKQFELKNENLLTSKQEKFNQY